MKKILLTPYPGCIHLAKNVADFKAFYKRRTGLLTDIPADTTGRMQPLAHEKYATEYLVWASSRLVLVHEFSHAVLQLFDHTGIDPCEAGGEPFAYLLEHLLAEAWKK